MFQALLKPCIWANSLGRGPSNLLYSKLRTFNVVSLPSSEGRVPSMEVELIVKVARKERSPMVVGIPPCISRAGETTRDPGGRRKQRMESAMERRRAKQSIQKYLNSLKLVHKPSSDGKTPEKCPPRIRLPESRQSVRCK